MNPVSIRLALWALNRFGTTDERSIIAGDLLEEYERGRSNAWFWFQVMSTVVIDTWHTIQRHWILAARAWLTTIAAYAVVEFVSVALIGPLRMSASQFLLITSVQHFAATWMAGRTHRGMGGALIPWIVVLIALWNVPEVLRLADASLKDGRYEPYLMGAALRALCACVAGALGATLSQPVAHPSLASKLRTRSRI